TRRRQWEEVDAVVRRVETDNAGGGKDRDLWCAVDHGAAVLVSIPVRGRDDDRLDRAPGDDRGPLRADDGRRADSGGDESTASDFAHALSLSLSSLACHESPARRSQRPLRTSPRRSPSVAKTTLS